MNTRLRDTIVICALACMPGVSLADPRPCTCKDLPALVKEIIEQEYLRDLFRKWSSYTPREFLQAADMQDRAKADFNDHFYPKKPGKSAAAQDGGHAALGTLYESEDCGIGEFQYNKNGEAINKKAEPIVQDLNANKGPDGKPKRKVPKDNEHWLKPISEKDYLNEPTKSCDALVRYAWKHEEVHQKTCQNLRAQGRTQMWNSLDFFAGNDADAYKAGTDYLRQATKQLALDCNWEGSTGDNAVPTPKRAKELSKNAAKVVKNRAAGGRKKTGWRAKGSAAILMGVTIDTSPMDELLNRWDTQCVDDSAEGCGALGASIEEGLVDLLRAVQRSSGLDRQTIFDAAHAQSPQLKRLAMSLLYNAQSAEEIEFALEAAEHPSSAVREAARQMLQGTDDPRWKAMERWWKSADSAQRNAGSTSGLVPDLDPRPEYFGVETLQGLRHRPYGSNASQVMFTTPEAADKVVERLAKGKTIMSNSRDMEKNAQGFEQMMMTMQQEMMAAAQAGDMQKINQITAKLMEMQSKLMPADPAAINTDEKSTGILLEKDTKTGLPVSVVRVRRDEESGQTLVIFERAQSH